MFFLQEDRPSINLEVVIFQDSELGLFFGRSFGTVICSRNLLTFSFDKLLKIVCNQLVLWQNVRIKSPENFCHLLKKLSISIERENNIACV